MCGNRLFFLLERVAISYQEEQVLVSVWQQCWQFFAEKLWTMSVKQGKHLLKNDADFNIYKVHTILKRIKCLNKLQTLNISLELKNKVDKQTRD